MTPSVLEDYFLHILAPPLLSLSIVFFFGHMLTLCILYSPCSGVPAVVDFAAMRDAVKKLGGDPAKINPVVPVDLVIDHSVQVDFFRR